MSKAKNFSQQKGKRGEREICHLLQPIVDKVYNEYTLEPPRLERNLMQSMKGGHDIVGLDWIAFEVKYCETTKIKVWWEQTREQAGRMRIPILFYRRSRVAWRVVMNGRLPIGMAGIGGLERALVDIALPDFLNWFEKRLRFALVKDSK